MAVAFDELAGSPFGGYQDGRTTINRRVVVAWADIDTYIAELVPPSIAAGGTNVTNEGAAYPENPLYRVSSYNWSPFNGESAAITGATVNGVNTYSQALFEIVYTVPQYASGGSESPEAHELEFDPVPLLAHSFESGGQFLQTPKTNLVWNDGTTPVNEDVPVGQFVPTTQHVIDYPHVVNPNWESLEKQKGTVNNATFSLRGYAYPEGTLLYLGYSGVQEVMSDGAKAWKLQLKFEAKDMSFYSEFFKGVIAVGHNHFYDPDTKYFRLIYKKDTDENLYAKTDFTQLFAAGQ